VSRPVIVLADGRRLRVPYRFTPGEMRLLELLAGVPGRSLMAALEHGNPRATRALVLVLLRRQDPTVTIRDVSELDLSELRFEDDPAPAAAPWERV
jgi:hypothetical protein